MKFERIRAHASALSASRAWLLPAPFVLWTAWSLSRGERRWEMAATALLAMILAYANAFTQRLYKAMFPVFLVGIAYDAQRLLGDLGLSEGRVHTCDVRALDASMFGIRSGGVDVAWPDRLQSLTRIELDVAAAIPYGTFIGVTVAYGVFLFLRDSAALERFAWSFLALNVAAFAIYRLYPTAPPWYVRSHGCAVDLATNASAGPHLASVDRLLGFGYFENFYGRSRDVFGAIPSLHVAYPLLIAIVGWRKHAALGRAASIGFFVWMCAAALYLDHHWFVDVVLGTVLTAVVYSLVSLVLDRPGRVRPDSLRAMSGAAGGFHDLSK